MPAPEIINNFPFEIFLVGNQFGIKKTGAFKGVLVQHSPAKSVYSEYSSLIEGPECFS
ncbi:hypothetical protein ES703_49673 [subsurface metagenome]